ncbi:MAG: hypothetical protein IPM95_10205 [Sphingobacteriales bacterium]|nr:hypothetical protein [Sphingobacteriales bacterium]
MQIESVTIPSKSGKSIPLTLRVPEVTVKGIVQINTGTCIPEQVYWKFAEFLTKNNYITVTYDYGDAANFRSAVSHTAWIADMESVTDYIIQEYASLKKYVVGHSSGGQLIGYTNNCRHFDKVFLVAASNGYVGNLTFPVRLGMWFFWKMVVPYSIRRYGYMNNKLFGSSGGFPKNIILELRSWCFHPDFFVPFFREQPVVSHYHTITNPVKEYHLADDVIANRKSCAYILNLYTHADKSIETLHANDYGMKKFGHRGFFLSSAEKLLWPKFLQDLEN